jgi:hypothetical protein
MEKKKFVVITTSLQVMVECDKEPTTIAHVGGHQF